LPPITLCELRAAMVKLRDEGENSPGQTSMFAAVRDQRELVNKAHAKTKAARRHAQRRKDAAQATVGPSTSRGGSEDYSQRVKPAKPEIWDD